MASYARPFKQCGADPDLVDRTSTRAMMLLIAACAADIQAKCAGFPGLEGRAACIKTRYKDFSLPCQLALVKARAVGKACRADIKKNCAGIKPGGGRIETCMKDHFADMSDACKEMISQAGSGKS